MIIKLGEETGVRIVWYKFDCHGVDSRGKEVPGIYVIPRLAISQYQNLRVSVRVENCPHSVGGGQRCRARHLGSNLIDTFTYCPLHFELPGQKEWLEDRRGVRKLANNRLTELAFEKESPLEDWKSIFEPQRVTDQV